MNNNVIFLNENESSRGIRIVNAQEYYRNMDSHKACKFKMIFRTYNRIPDFNES
jgi:hypothetical protein